MMDGADGAVGGVDGVSSEFDNTRLRLTEFEIGMEFSRMENSVDDSDWSISSEACRFRLPCLASDEEGIRVGRGEASATVESISTTESDGNGTLVGVWQAVS